MKQKPGAFAWTELSEIKNVSRQEQLLMDEAKDAKLLEGIGLALHGPNGQIVGMGVASSAGGTELHRDTVSTVYLLCTQFNQIYQTLEREKSVIHKIVDLSEREKEILTWLAVGKSKSVVGDILNISEHTVKTYLQRVFAKLDVHTKQEAIVHAIRMGLINPALSAVKPNNVTH